MKLGIGKYYLVTYGEDKGAEIMASHGYNYIDFELCNTESEYYTAKEDFFLTKVMKLKRTLDANGISVEQIHGPWRYPPKDQTEDDRAERFGKMAKAIAIAKHLGAKYMAIHPLMPFGAESPDNPEEVYEINKRFYTALAAVAGKLGVTVCLENMPFREFPLSSTKSIISLIKDIDDPHLKFCFDVGHSCYYGEPIGESIRTAGKDYLKILHVHDNNGDEDSHLPPYEGSIDWSEFCEALYDIGYDGVLNLETTPMKYKDLDKNSSEEVTKKELELAKIGKLLAQN